MATKIKIICLMLFLSVGLYGQVERASRWTLLSDTTLQSLTGINGVITPKLIGGTTTTSDLWLQTTNNTGATGADMHFLVGNNGGTEAMTILNDGKVGIGTSPINLLHISSVSDGFNIRLTNPGQTGIIFETTTTGDDYYFYNNYGSFSVRNTTDSRTDFEVTGVGNVHMAPVSGSIGIGTTTPYAQYSQVGATPIWYATDSDFNLHRTSLAFATDTAAIKIDASVTQPIITFKNTIGNGFALQSVAAGGASFDGGLTIAGKLTQTNQSAIAGTITSDYSVVYPYDDGSNVKVMALLDDAGTETTTQVLTGNMWGEPSGGAILNGTTQYYSHANNASLNFGTGDFSIEVYFKTSNVAYGYLAGKRDGTNGYDFFVNTNGNLRMTIYGASATNDYITTTQVADGIWHYVVAKISDANITLYKDGSLIGTQTSAITPGDVTDPFYVGQRSGSALPLNGVISFVRVNNHALTQSEVTKRWNNGQPHLYVEPYATKGASQTELVTNGDMELDSDWANNGTPTTNERSTDFVRAGTYSRKFVGDAGSDGINQTIVPTVAGKKYHVNAYSYLSASTAIGIKGEIRSSGATLLATLNTVSDTGSWQLMTTTFIATGASSVISLFQTGAGAVTAYIDDVTIKSQGETFSIANTDWGASGAVCTIGGTKSIANSTAYPIAVSGKYDARKTMTANREFTSTAKVGSILKYVKVTNPTATADTVSVGTTGGASDVISSQVIGASSTAIVNVAKWFSDSAQQTLFLHSPSWASDTLNAVLIYEPIGEKL